MGDGHARCGPEEGDGTHACMLLGRQTHAQAQPVVATLHEDVKTNSSHMIENIEEFPPELGFSHQPPSPLLRIRRQSENAFLPS